MIKNTDFRVTEPACIRIPALPVSNCVIHRQVTFLKPQFLYNHKKRLCYRELKKKVRKSPPYSRFPHLSEGTERDLHVWHLACMHAKSLSRVWLFATLWTVAHQTPLSMRFSRQEYWSGFPCPSPGDPPDPEIEPASLTSLTSPALAGRFFTTSAAWEALDTLGRNIEKGGNMVGMWIKG